MLLNQLNIFRCQQVIKPDIYCYHFPVTTDAGKIMDNKIDATTVMLCWTPFTSDVTLVPWPDKSMLSRGYLKTSLACYQYVHEMSFNERRKLISDEAKKLIDEDGCPEDVVHQVLSRLAEYQN